MARPSFLLPPLLALTALAGCAGSSGPFPSLLPRPIEREFGDPGVPPKVAPVPDDPEVAARASAFVAAAREGDRTFHAALPAAEAAARHAGTAGSDSWIVAQQAVSRAEAAEQPITHALSEFDLYATDRGKAKPLSQADLDHLQNAEAEVQRIADAEHAEIDRLQRALKGP
jgi:hypothetical protein